MDIHIIPAYSLTDSIAGFRTIMVFTITYGLFEVRLTQEFQDAWMGTFTVIALKMIHITTEMTLEQCRMVIIQL